MKQTSPGPHTGREVRWCGMEIESITDTFEAAIRGGINRPPRPEEQVTLHHGTAGVVGDLVRTIGDTTFYAVRFPALDLTIETDVPGHALTLLDTGEHPNHHAA